MDPGKKGIEYMWIVFSIMIIGGCSGIVEQEYHPDPAPRDLQRNQPEKKDNLPALASLVKVSINGISCIPSITHRPC